MYPVNTPAADWYAENEARAQEALRAYQVDYAHRTMSTHPVAPVVHFPTVSFSYQMSLPIPLPTGSRARLKLLKAIICRGARLTEEELNDPSRDRSAVIARAVLYHFARRYTDLSLSQLGLAVGRRDHSTVVHSLKRVERYPEEHEDLIAYVRKHVQFPEG